MKLRYLCLLGLTALPAIAHAGRPSQSLQSFTAVVWTKTTLHSPTGKATVFMRRTIYTRDTFGNVRREIYQPTKGLLHDTTAPLEHVFTGSSSADVLPEGRFARESVTNISDLGTSRFFGLSATGKHTTIQDTDGKRSRSLNTWFSPALGITVHMESTNSRGDTMVGELTELHMGTADSPTPGSVAVAHPAVPLLVLYRGLFSYINHLEHEKYEPDPGHTANMDEIEAHLRIKLGISLEDWQTLVAKSIEVERYTREKTRDAHAFAAQEHALRQGNDFEAHSRLAGRATLHRMQADLNQQVLKDINRLKAAIRPEAGEQVEAYLKGPFSQSTSVTTLKSIQTNIAKEQAR